MLTWKKAELEADENLKGRYIMLDRVDVHCVWVSQAVLELLPDPLVDIPGGEIIREPGMGVFCDNAMDLIMLHWPRPGVDMKKRFVKDAMKSLNSVGLVGMHDAGVVPKDLDLYKEMAGKDDWTVRVYAMIECEKRNTFCPEQVSKFVHEDGFLQIQSVKLFAGGSFSAMGKRFPLS